MLGKQQKIRKRHGETGELRCGAVAGGELFVHVQRRRATRSRDPLYAAD